MNLWQLSSLGIEFAIILLLFVFGGHYLDQKFSLSPWCLLGMSFLGFAYGIYYLVRRTDSFK
ncbi:MAG: AtpZ/AtpI family protein [Leptospiraceae bacterium]|nr:AtpZ/AtpI family protein [Leptospiraceae bacterium]